MDFKKAYQKHKKNLIPAIKMTRAAIGHVIEMRENPRMVDYVDLGFNIKDSYSTIYANRSRSFFSDDKWKRVFRKETAVFVSSMLQFHYGTDINTPKNTESSVAHVLTINGVSFGWHTGRDNGTDSFYIEKGKVNRGYQIIADTFWSKNDSGSAVLSSLQSGDIVLSEDRDSKFITTRKSTDYADYIKKFLHNGISRSILFYGPPGSGKTNLVKGICKHMNIKTIRVLDLDKIANNQVTEVIKVFNPDAVLLEDIDSMSQTSTADLLSKLEHFNNQNKILLATANQVMRLDQALIRPGRFDEVVEIKNLEIEVLSDLVSGDEEVLEMVKEFPVASTVELLKRIKVLGKERALASIGDIVARIENFDMANYKLKMQGVFGSPEDTAEKIESEAIATPVNVSHCYNGEPVD